MGFVWHILWWGKSMELSIDLKECMVKSKNKNYQAWLIRSCWKTCVNGHSQVCVASPWAAMQERSPCYRHSNFKLDWSLPLITWTKKKTFLRKALQQCVRRQEVEAFHSEPTTTIVKHGDGGIGIVLLPVENVNGIMKKEDNLQILKGNLKSSARRWL